LIVSPRGFGRVESTKVAPRPVDKDVGLSGALVFLELRNVGKFGFLFHGNGLSEASG
jgi:hypothetical protein